MIAEEFRAWHAHMGYTSQQAAADALGVSLATYKRMLTHGTDHLASLACAALAAGLGPWKP